MDHKSFHMALELWEMGWEQLTSTPSRLTAEPMERAERDRFFTQVTANAYVDNYTGIRISSSGRRFYIVNATVWNLVDEQGIYRGQAATFVDYKYIYRVPDQRGARCNYANSSR
ncbi:MEKHLA domain-containing protein [Paenibacillus glycanilyticus]|uniref:MEKHLA domain-containing protein n=1 Tax=Paenibacillus glycanilyticus TaxID=126569 RepID=UPI00203D2866|nr:MEKHLA domain-containing protein [Paenibacillus glycanilyticus]MCM3630688.1 MEKHLA domain-containing protein [Paenibacillus glycanilyticus]